MRNLHKKQTSFSVSSFIGQRAPQTGRRSSYTLHTSGCCYAARIEHRERFLSARLELFHSSSIFCFCFVFERSCRMAEKSYRLTVRMGPTAYGCLNLYIYGVFGVSWPTGTRAHYKCEDVLMSESQCTHGSLKWIQRTHQNAKWFWNNAECSTKKEQTPGTWRMRGAEWMHAKSRKWICLAPKGKENNS